MSGGVLGLVVSGLGLISVAFIAYKQAVKVADRTSGADVTVATVNRDTEADNRMERRLLHVEKRVDELETQAEVDRRWRSAAVLYIHRLLRHIESISHPGQPSVPVPEPPAIIKPDVFQ